MKRKNPIAVLTGWLALVLGPGHPTLAAESETHGSIQGRVLNATSGAYLNNARIVVRGSAVEAFTDEDGAYRLGRVPAGEVTVVAFHTGLAPETVTVRVPAGGTVAQDFSLSRADAGRNGLVKMDEFVVAANREFNAQAIAINEQRYAANIKSVVSTDEFGDIGEANIGEFIKFMPGLTVNYSVGVMAVDITVRGFPASATSVTMDGGQPANPGGGTSNRQFDLQQLQALNSVARVEVLKSPTPDIPANMLGGAVNIITKSAFERERPVFSYRFMGTGNTKHLGGSYPSIIRDRKLSTIRPSLDFGYVVPLSRNLGFTLSGGYNSRFMTVDTGEGGWDLVQLIQTNYQIQSSVQTRNAGSWGATADWKFRENHVLSGSLTYSGSHVLAPRIGFATNVGANRTGGPTFTQSTNTTGTATHNAQHNDRHDQTWHGSVKYRHTGKVWRVDANGYHSSATSKLRYVGKDAFSATALTLPSVAIRYNDIGQSGRPGPSTVTATAAGNVPVDNWDAGNYQLRTVTDGRRSAHATTRGGRVNASRGFDFAVPFTLKTGLYLSEETRDHQAPSRQWTFLGPDGIANNADNLAHRYDFFDTAMSSEPLPYGFPVARVVSPHKVYDYFLANPGQFQLNEVGAITDRTNTSHRITETISAAYLRGDVKLLANRLLLVGGVRFERTQDEGYGALNDLRATLRQDSNGNLLLDSAGRTIPVTTDPVARAHLQFKERGTYGKRSYDGYYPSLNASYNVSDSIVARFAYARTIGRPQYSNIIPGTTVSAPDATNPTITINNTGLRPWTANAYDLSLEKYFANNGVASIGFFRKDIDDFFGAITTTATTEALAELGLDDEYIDYDIRTTRNVGSARISGVEVNYRQALTFLPSWARGVQIFANGTYNDLDGNQDADFNNFATRTANWGISLNRPRYSVKLNWNGNDDIRVNRIAPSAAFPEDTYFWVTHRTTMDASFELRLNRKFSIFGTARNLTNRRVTRDRYAPETPEYAYNNRYLKVGAFVSLGVKGEF